MKKQTYDNWMKVLTLQYPDKEMNTRVMWEFLKDLDDLSFEKSITKILTTETNINKSTNMIALIRQNAITRGSTAGEAWGEVLNLVGRIGRYGIPEFSNEIVAKAVSAIGWRTICMSENIGIERAYFFKIYESLESRDREKKLIPGTKVNLIEDTTRRIK